MIPAVNGTSTRYTNARSGIEIAGKPQEALYLVQSVDPGWSIWVSFLRSLIGSDTGVNNLGSVVLCVYTGRCRSSNKGIHTLFRELLKEVRKFSGWIFFWDEVFSRRKRSIFSKKFREYCRNKTEKTRNFSKTLKPKKNLNFY